MGGKGSAFTGLSLYHRHCNEEGDRVDGRRDVQEEQRTFGSISDFLPRRPLPPPRFHQILNHPDQWATPATDPPTGIFSTTTRRRVRDPSWRSNLARGDPARVSPRHEESPITHRLRLTHPLKNRRRRKGRLPITAVRVRINHLVHLRPAASAPGKSPVSPRVQIE
ncbi:hypothetical protein BDP81DRAFT_429368 [Colletotrichum phormii]|uniref:Uncharacterized protein n=1 Tax=Colletotrichum phormii TaxID=359342 RepID=A0AAI9ZQK6_9PEZI|nr:uncharacterized protein BDP81DRAFT_429368 [Colletotrichum phormii]KAK1636268.1 hypothetical protein BDP81DRAFT_429368 [Colletotrichum phormii]